MDWVDLPVYLITEGCCHIDYTERSKVGRERVSGLQSIFRIISLMRFGEELTSHMVAMEELLSPHFSMVHDYLFHCTVLFWTSRAARGGAPEHNWDWGMES